ncbi:hypothetical protein N185_35860 [Sinorhizobium sp. GW3]|jgi:hypothetical protein|nr:hypothetical protein N185_35860 [Sinorhizobium sp. GW3]RAS09591.1 hypothetical protein DEU52_11418 [Ensifer adhaerens]
MMDLEVDRLWNEPVILDREGHLLRVQSTRSLSVLENHWSLHEGPAYALAIATC